MKKTEKEFEFVNRIVNFHWERAIGLANLESLLTYWSVGRFLSSRLKAATWGSKTIEELSDYLQRRNARLRGYGKRQLYNMVEFYEAYTSDEFAILPDDFGLMNLCSCQLHNWPCRVPKVNLCRRV